MIRLIPGSPFEGLDLAALIRFLREEFARMRYFFQNLRKDGANFNIDADLTVTGTLTAATLDATTLGSATTEAVQDLVALLLAAGANISVSYNDPGGTLTVALSGVVPVANGGTGLSALGAANTLLGVNGAGTADAYALLVDANVSASAAIGWSKVSKSGSSLADLATRSAGALNSGNLPYAQMPTGTGAWDTGAATTATVTRALTVGGILTAGTTASQNELKGMQRIEGASATANALTTFQGADTVTRHVRKIDGTQEDGTGSATRDCRFRRTNVSEYTIDTPAAGACALIITGKTTMQGSLAHTGSAAGFYNVTAVARPSAITQTYATADKTHAARTASALTDSIAGVTGTTLAAIPDPADTPATADALRDDLVANVLPKIRNALSSLSLQLNNGRTDCLDSAQLLNSVVDDLQSLGLEQ